jgi:hypothetical protein
MSETTRLDHPRQNTYGWFGWYVRAAASFSNYLHADGVIRESIRHGGNDSGYFATEAEALAAIAKFQASQEATK